jgi:hypothetical protein
MAGSTKAMTCTMPIDSSNCGFEACHLACVSRFSSHTQEKMCRWLANCVTTWNFPAMSRGWMNATYYQGTIPVLLDKASIPDSLSRWNYIDATLADWHDRLLRSLDHIRRIQ